jgi:DNA-binding protein H-NS
MTQTYHQLTRQIADLQAQAEGAKRSEVAGVIAKAKEAIQVYGLTQQDLFDSKTARATKVRKPAKGPTGKKAKSAEAKYADGKGGFWVGRGKRPRWLSDLLKAGAQLEDFLASKLSGATPAPADIEPAAMPVAPETPVATPTSKKSASKKVAAKKAPAKAAAKKAAKPKYQDGTGNSWSGFGPRPKWLREGIAGGKKLEDFLS